MRKQYNWTDENIRMMMKTHIHSRDIYEMDMRDKNPSTASAKSNLFTRRLGLFLFHCIAFYCCVVSLRWLSFFECVLNQRSRTCAFLFYYRSSFFNVLSFFRSTLLHFLYSSLIVSLFLSLAQRALRSTHFYYVLFGIRESFTDLPAQSTIVMAELCANNM